MDIVRRDIDQRAQRLTLFGTGTQRQDDYALGDLGDNNSLNMEQRFASPYAICDSQWHRIQAGYDDEELVLKVDELDQKYNLSMRTNYHLIITFAGSTAYGPLYISGISDTIPMKVLFANVHPTIIIVTFTIHNTFLTREKGESTKQEGYIAPSYSFITNYRYCAFLFI